MSDVKATKHTLSTNLNRLMEANLSLASNPKLAKRSKLGLGTIARIRNADVLPFYALFRLLKQNFLRDFDLLLFSSHARFSRSLTSRGIPRQPLQLSMYFPTMSGSIP